MADPPNRCPTSCPSPLSWTTSHKPSPRYPRPNRIIHILTRSRQASYTNITGGVEVHIKVDYRVDEASATVSPCRHTTYYFWPWDVDATRVLGNISELSASLFSLWSQTEQNFYSKVESQLFIVLRQHDVKIGILGNLAPAPSQHIPEHQNICWIWSETQKSTFFFFFFYKLDL